MTPLFAKTCEPLVARITSLAPGRFSSRAPCRPGGLDVLGDLGDQVGLGLEGPLVPEPEPELHDEPLAVQVALEVEQVGFDPTLVAAVMRVDADRDGGAVPAPRAGVDAVGRDGELG